MAKEIHSKEYVCKNSEYSLVNMDARFNLLEKRSRENQVFKTDCNIIWITVACNQNISKWSAYYIKWITDILCHNLYWLSTNIV